MPFTGNPTIDELMFEVCSLEVPVLFALHLLIDWIRFRSPQKQPP